MKPVRPARAATASALLLGCMLGSAHAAGNDVEDVLGGFDDAISDVAKPEATPESEPLTLFGWTLDGSLSASASYNLKDHDSSTGTDYGGLSKLRLRGNFGLEKKFENEWRAVFSAYAWHDAAYALRDADYSNEVLDAYRSDTDIQDAFIEGKLGDNWDLKVGRQVVVWGFADNLRVLDVLNPLDNLEPGLVDIEDLRLPTGMLKLDHYSGGWRVGAILVPEIRFSKNPPFGSDFYALTDANGNAVKIREEIPNDFEAPSYALSASGVLKGVDVKLNLARLWNDEPYLDPTAFDVNAPGASNERFFQDAVLRHSRVNLAGFGLQKTWGSWLFKQELAVLDKLLLTETGEETVNGPLPNLGALPVLGGLPLPTPTPLPGGGTTVVIPNAVSAHTQTSWLLGVEYFGLANTNIAVEIASRYIGDFNDQLEASGYLERRTESSFRVTRDFLNERLRSNLIVILFDQDHRFLGKDGGAIYRVNAEYELATSLMLSGGAVFYDGGNQRPFALIEENDRVFTEVRWSF